MVGSESDEMLVVGPCLLVETLAGVDIGTEEERFLMVGTQVEYVVIIRQRVLLIPPSQVE